jgi:hypothetical protein
MVAGERPFPCYFVFRLLYVFHFVNNIFYLFVY